MAENMNAADVLGANFADLDPGGGNVNKLPYVDASYVIEVEKASIFPSNNPQTHGQPIFKLEFVVVETGHPDVIVGAKKSWTQNLAKAHGSGTSRREYGKENVKQFVAAVYGVDPSTPEAAAIDTPHVQSLLDGACKGMLVRCDTVPKPGKPGQNDWTLHIFSPYNDESAAEEA